MTHQERLVLGGSSSVEAEAEHLARYHYAAQFVEGLDVLDAASGSGYGSRILADAGARSVVGVDVAEEAVAMATAANHAPEVLSYRQGDVQALDLADDSFDAVVSFETIEHLPDDHAYLSEIRRVLRPGGLFIVTTPDRRLSGIKASFGKGNPYHLREYILRELMSLLEEHGFAVEQVCGQRYLHAAFGRMPVKVALAVARRIKPFPGDQEPKGTGAAVIPRLPGRRIARFWVISARSGQTRH